MDQITPATLSERAAQLASAAESAPFFPAGLRENLTRAAEFCSAAAAEVEAMGDRLAGLKTLVQDLHTRAVIQEREVEALRVAQAASTAAEAGFIEKFGELDERTDALETLAAAPKP